MNLVDVIYFQIYDKEQKYCPLDYFKDDRNNNGENYTILKYKKGKLLTVEKREFSFDVIKGNIQELEQILENKDKYFVSTSKKERKKSSIVSFKSEGEYQPYRSSSSTFSQPSYKNEMFNLWYISEAREKMSYQEFLNEILGGTKNKKKESVNKKHVEWLDSVSAEEGGPKIIKKNVGNGDCFFWAILHSYYNDNGNYVNQQIMLKLRTNVGDWVSENEQRLNTEGGIKPWIDDSLTQYNDFENLVSDIKKPTVWVDNLVVQLTVEYLNTPRAVTDRWLTKELQPIAVYIYSGKEGASVLKLPNDETIGNTHLHLVYHSGVHYEGSVNNSSAGESSKN